VIKKFWLGYLFCRLVCTALWSGNNASRYKTSFFPPRSR